MEPKVTTWPMFYLRLYGKYLGVLTISSVANLKEKKEKSEHGDGFMYR